MYQSQDGKGFTNKPAARAHDARTAHASKKSAPHMNPDGTANQAHNHEQTDEAMVCPACGAQFMASEGKPHAEGEASSEMHDAGMGEAGM